MAVFSSITKTFEERSIDEEAIKTQAIGESFMIDDNGNRRYISEDHSLALTAVWACVRIISSAVSILPIHLYAKTAQGRVQTSDHPCANILDYPNDYTTRFNLIRMIMTHTLLWGNGYIRIYRDKYHRPSRLQVLHPATVEPRLTTGHRLYYVVDGQVVEWGDMVHLKELSTNGYKGKSPIAVHRESLQLSFSALDYGEKFFSQGGNMSGVFTHPGTLKDERYKELKADLIGRSTGLHNSHVPLVLEGGMKYERISIPPEDAQFLATRKFGKTEVATIFGVPPHMIADLDRATNNNIEHQGMEFVNFCLLSYLVQLEQEFNRKLLRDDEAGKFYYLFGIGALLRGDSKTRSEYYKNMTYIGAMSANEVRALEDLNNYEGGNEYFVPTNMQTVEHAIKGIINTKSITNGKE